MPSGSLALAVRVAVPPSSTAKSPTASTIGASFTAFTSTSTVVAVETSPSLAVTTNFSHELVIPSGEVNEGFWVSALLSVTGAPAT